MLLFSSINSESVFISIIISPGSLFRIESASEAKSEQPISNDVIVVIIFVIFLLK